MWVESVSGSPFNNTMVAGPDLKPHLWEGLSPSFGNTYFNGTYNKISATATNSSSKAYGANYGVFSGLTNDAVLIRTGTGDYQNGSLNGFQIIPVAGPSISAVTISSMVSGSSLALTWPHGTLQTATDLLGPWTDSSATSPFTDTMTNAALFYRVKVQ